jgi:hypothetical protein
MSTSGNSLVLDHDPTEYDIASADAAAEEASDLARQAEVDWAAAMRETETVEAMISVIVNTNSPVVQRAYCMALYTRGRVDGVRDAREAVR